MMLRNSFGSSRMWLVMVLALALPCGVLAQKEKAAKSDASGHYEGSAKNAAGEVIEVKLDLTEKDGAMTGMIRSSHGDFTITGGSHQGEDIKLEFDAGGPTGTIALKSAEDKWTGTWSAGDDGGPVEVKKVAAAVGDAKEKS